MTDARYQELAAKITSQFIEGLITLFEHDFAQANLYSDYLTGWKE